MGDDDFSRDTWGLTEKGLFEMARYFTETSGEKFYMDLEDGPDSEALRVKLFLLFGDGPGQYDYATYRDWAEQALG